MIPKTLEWKGGIDGTLEMIDQRKLPGTFEHLNCRTVEQLFYAIQTLAVRGAPAIGVSAAYGICLAVQQPEETEIDEILTQVKKQSEYLATSRPTAVNLFWALNRMVQFAENLVDDEPDTTPVQFREALLEEAHTICREDQQMCRAIGQHGAKLIRRQMGLLTHCNAGALATSGIGTALAPMYVAHENGICFRVFADETRPLLQGARITAWELAQTGIETKLICDNMAATVLRNGDVQLVITGADRIAANGDAANKIGTYPLAVMAKRHNVPFYIAAPTSTFDMELDSGSKIPIEQRSPAEVLGFGDCKTGPDGVGVYNPAFDVTPADLITGIITEKGIIEEPDTQKIVKLFEE